MDIWFMTINYLREQLDEVCGHSNNVVTAYLPFWQKWQNTPMVMEGGNGQRWNYHSHVGCFLLSSNPPFVVGHKILLVLVSAEGHIL